MDAMRKSIKVARAILGRRPLLLSNNFQLKIYPGGIRRLAQAVHHKTRTVRVCIFPRSALFTDGVDARATPASSSSNFFFLFFSFENTRSEILDK
jgi:hypothetical protein